MSLFPVYLKLDGKKVVVVGGGKVAERKVFDLLQSGGNVSIISPFLSAGLAELLKEGLVQWIAEPFSSQNFPDKVFLIVAATDNPEINKAVYDFAKLKNILINVVDQPELCDFYVPSIVRKGDLAIAISTGGKVPSFSRALREFFENLLSDDFGKAIIYMDKLRTKLKKSDVPEKSKILLSAARTIVDRLMNGSSWTETRYEVEEDLKNEI